MLPDEWTEFPGSKDTAFDSRLLDRERHPTLVTDERVLHSLQDHIRLHYDEA
jgi:hypothetical protein